MPFENKEDKEGSKGKEEKHGKENEKLVTAAEQKKQNITKEISDIFVCSITNQVMRHPVITYPDGQTYELAALLQWFKTSNTLTSPLTRQRVMAVSKNLVLKSLIGILESESNYYPSYDENAALTAINKLLARGVLVAEQNNIEAPINDNVYFLPEIEERDDRRLRGIRDLLAQNNHPHVEEKRGVGVDLGLFLRFAVNELLMFNQPLQQPRARQQRVQDNLIEQKFPQQAPSVLARQNNHVLADEQQQDLYADLPPLEEVNEPENAPLDLMPRQNNNSILLVQPVRVLEWMSQQLPLLISFMAAPGGYLYYTLHSERMLREWNDIRGRPFSPQQQNNEEKAVLARQQNNGHSFWNRAVRTSSSVILTALNVAATSPMRMDDGFAVALATSITLINQNWPSFFSSMRDQDRRPRLIRDAHNNRENDVIDVNIENINVNIENIDEDIENNDPPRRGGRRPCCTIS